MSVREEANRPLSQEQKANIATLEKEFEEVINEVIDRLDDILKYSAISFFYN